MKFWPKRKFLWTQEKLQVMKDGMMCSRHDYEKNTNEVWNTGEPNSETEARAEVYEDLGRVQL